MLVRDAVSFSSVSDGFGQSDGRRDRVSKVGGYCISFQLKLEECMLNRFGRYTFMLNRAHRLQL